eukprot:709347-Prymnesium_polylepis.1
MCASLESLAHIAHVPPRQQRSIEPADLTPSSSSHTLYTLGLPTEEAMRSAQNREQHASQRIPAEVDLQKCARPLFAAERHPSARSRQADGAERHASRKPERKSLTMPTPWGSSRGRGVPPRAAVASAAQRAATACTAAHRSCPSNDADGGSWHTPVLCSSSFPWTSLPSQPRDVRRMH